MSRISFRYILILNFILTISLHTATYLVGQSGNFDGGAAWRSSMAGMVQADLIIANVYTNPASISNDGWAIDLGVERRFQQDLTSLYSVGGYSSVGSSVFALSAVRRGGEGLVEQKVQLGYARKIAAPIRMGVNFVMHQLNLSDFGSKTYFSFDAGVAADISKKLSLHTLANNPVGIRFDEETLIPSRFVLTAIYNVGPKAAFLAEVEKVLDYDPSVKLGIVYKPANKIRISLGGDVSRGVIGIGVCYSISDFKIAGAYTGHQNLGLYPSMNIAYQKSRLQQNQ